MIDGCGISCETAVRWISLDLCDDKSTLVQAMAWCHQATSHYLSQCWPRSMSPCGITRPRWVLKQDSLQVDIEPSMPAMVHPKTSLTWIKQKFHVLINNFSANESCCWISYYQLDPIGEEYKDHIITKIFQIDTLYYDRTHAESNIIVYLSSGG